MVRRAESGDLDVAFSNINDICGSKVSFARINRMKTINPPTKYHLSNKLVTEITMFEQR